MRQLYLLALLAAAVPGLAVAQTPPPPSGPAQTAPAPDPSSDPMKPMFDQADTNHDGSLNLAEWTAAGRGEAAFKMFDADGDGKITFAEAKAAMARLGGGG